jgi:hypothetical protein
MTKRAYELLVRFGQGEHVAGAHVKEMHLDDEGKDLRETAPVPLADADNPVFKSFADKFSAKAVAENEVLKSQKATLQSELNAKAVEVTSLTQTVASLQSQIDSLLNPPGPDVTTREGLKAYLAQIRYEKEISGFFVGSQLISTNRDELAHWFARFFDAFNHLQGNPSASGGVYPYKPRGGTTVVNLTAEQAVRSYQCLAWYVNACIATEGEIIPMIENAQLSQLVDVKEVIDNAATWPQRQFEWVPS